MKAARDAGRYLDVPGEEGMIYDLWECSTTSMTEAILITVIRCRDATTMTR